LFIFIFLKQRSGTDKQCLMLIPWCCWKLDYRSLHCPLKLKIRNFVNMLMLEKRNTWNFTYWFWFS